MKQYWLILLSCLCFSGVYAQQKANIVADLNSTKVGQGSVRVYEDESIEGLIGNRILTSIPSTVSNSNGTSISSPSSTKATAFREIAGYKIQVFSGNDQRRSRREGEYRRSQIESAYPDMETNLTFNPPVWRLRVGNFRTYEEAFQTMTEMKSKFPAFGKEMQIVKARIKVPIY